MQKQFHPNNLHNGSYDFNALIQSHKPLQSFVQKNAYGNVSIDFSNPQAVLCLNQALLKYFYHIDYWEIPKGYLCPPIPGRVDYIHYIADLLKECDIDIQSNKIRGLDIGVGANGIYTLLANRIYDWNMLGSDIDEVSINNVQSILAKNKISSISVIQQKEKKFKFKGIVDNNDFYLFSLCNPPFFKSKKEAHNANKRKTSNLTKQKVQQSKFNFGGQSNELWCDGGEVAFIKSMIDESTLYANHIVWFTTLVSKKESLLVLEKHLKKIKPAQMKTIEMKQGNKITRFIAWSFLTKEAQKQWCDKNLK